MPVLKLSAAALLVTLSAGAASLTPEQRKLNVDSFEYAWKAIQDHMWEPMPASLDWSKVHDEIRPRVEAAETMNQARAAMRDMVGRLKMTHFAIIPAEVYENLDEATKGKGHGGSPGFDIRILDGQHAIVHWIETDSPAYAAGVRNGWEILAVGSTQVPALLERLDKALPDGTTRELIATRALAARFDGNPGKKITAKFLDSAGVARGLDIELKPERGTAAKFGYLATQYVWFETRRIGDAGYIRFNMFLDPARLAAQFEDAVQSCMRCRGIVIDLRGNPGGLGGMSMGMAGWFISKADVRLGVMKMKGAELKFAVNPRAETFNGPVAILVDALTGSTSEILAGGMKDVGRARIFGTRTAGAALPSVFEKLPNGDGFQYAIANYISQGGKPLEGIGVIPDREVKSTREALLAGRDPALDAAVEWIKGDAK